MLIPHPLPLLNHVPVSCEQLLIEENPQEHKKKVKEEKREARKTKIPKHLKKKLIAGSSKKK